MRRSILVSWAVVVVALWGSLSGAQGSGSSVELVIGGDVVATFEALSGLGSSNEVIEQVITLPDGQTIRRKIPGRLSWLDVTLSRGVSGEPGLWDWRQQVVDGDVAGARSDVDLVLRDGGAAEVARWRGVDCWPSRIEARLDPANPAAIESLVLACEGFTRVGPTP